MKYTILLILAFCFSSCNLENEASVEGVSIGCIMVGTTNFTSAAQAAGVKSTGIRVRITKDNELRVTGRLSGIVSGTPFTGQLLEARLATRLMERFQ